MGTIWIQYAQDDPFFMTTILCHSSVHLDMVYQRPPSRLTLYYKSKVVDLKLSQLGFEEQFPRDTTIAAIAMMLASQVCVSILLCDLGN